MIRFHSPNDFVITFFSVIRGIHRYFINLGYFIFGY